MILSFFTPRRAGAQLPEVSSARNVQTGTAGRTPERWRVPLPHVDGTDDPGLHSLGLVIPDTILRYWRTHSPSLAGDLSVLPASIDWSGFDSPVKAQGHCGACWAFATVAAIENAGRQTDLSEQVLISCSGGGNCSGGFYESALVYVHASGLPSESSDPYTETDGDCAARSASPPFLERARAVKTCMWGGIAQLNDLKAALQNGPVVVSMVVFSDFDAYSSGVYHHTTGFFKGYHALLAVGYNDDEKCFKAKNSWGTDWGEGGYCRVSYDDLANGVNFGGYGAQVLETFTVSVVAGIEEEYIPSGWRLEQNYPNPFNASTLIKYTVGVAGDKWQVAREAGTGGLGLGTRNVRLVVYDLLGREMAVLVDEKKAPGSYEVSFSASGGSGRGGSNRASGVYIYRLTAGSYVLSRKMMFLK